MSNDLVSYDDQPRAPLKSLPPVAFGTPLSESLESYLERLCAVHDIQRKQLECFVTGELESQKRSLGLVEPIRVDSAWPTTQAFASSLSTLTQQPNVARLGFGWLTAVLAGADALRPRSAWCTLCVRDCHVGKRAPYLPLSWAVKSVEACVEHRVALVSTCRNCSSTFGPRSGLRFPFLNCPRCLVPLDAVCEGEPQRAQQATEKQVMVSEEVGKMIGALQALGPDAVLTIPKLRKVIQSAVDRGVCSGTIELVRRAQISKSTLSALLQGSKAGLDTWVRIALAADVSLAGLFAPELWAEGVRGTCISWRSELSEARRRPSLDWDAVRRDVGGRLERSEPISIYALGKLLSADPMHLKKQLGPLAEELQVAASKRRAAELAETAKSLAQKIRGEAVALRENGSRISARSIAKRVSQGRASIVFVMAFQEVAAEIGHSPIRGRSRTRSFAS